jgi:hypothetical protein
MGEGFFPNSVLAKTAISKSPQQFIDRLNTDHLVPVLLIVAIAYLVGARPATRQSIVPAVTVVVAILAHTLFARYGYFERYQVYLIALGVYFALSIAGEAALDRTKAAAVIILSVLVLTPVKWNLLFLTPRAADNTYQQRYQAALFVRRYYRTRPIATSELGYISLLHQGSISDLLGLGDYEVLKHRKNGTDNQAFYADLARRRGFPIAISYSGDLGSRRTPTAWFLVASWELHGRPVSAPPDPLQFWATDAAAALELRADLEDNAHRLPHHLTQILNACLDAQLTHTKTLWCATSGP